jgi:glycosyltransferase involved in cell wall biosynthesis
MIRVSYLYDLPLPSPKAAPTQILNTCRELAVAGIPTTVFTRKLVDEPAACLAFYGLDPHPNLAIRPLFSRPAWRLYPPWPLARLLAQRGDGRPHIILSRGETALAVAPWLRRVPRREALFVYEAHRLCFAHEVERQSGKRWDETVPLSEPFRQIYERERTTVEEADGVVCLTEGVRRTLTQLFTITRPTLVLPSGTSVPEDDATARAGERDIDVIYVGKLAVRKGVPLLIAAMRHLPGRRLCVVGGSPEEVAASRDLIRGDEVESRIDFTGFIEPWRVRAYLGRARVGVCPLPVGTSITSDQFTSPLKLLEMMAYRVPVVASDVPPTRSIVIHGETAWLVPAEDPAALAGGIQTLLDDPALADRLAAAARQRVEQFSWQGRARRLLDFLEALTDHRRSNVCAGKAMHD